MPCSAHTHTLKERCIRAHTSCNVSRRCVRFIFKFWIPVHAATCKMMSGDHFSCVRVIYNWLWEPDYLRFASCNIVIYTFRTTRTVYWISLINSSFVANSKIDNGFCALEMCISTAIKQHYLFNYFPFPFLRTSNLRGFCCLFCFIQQRNFLCELCPTTNS